MKILVCVKQVPGRDSTLLLNASNTWLDESGLSFEMNEPDAYALEEALQLKEKAGGEIVVVGLGPARVQSTLREALAKGADRAIFVEIAADNYLDPLEVARILAQTIAAEVPDLVLTGLQSDDLGLGQTGVILAELLGFPHATIVMEVEPVERGLRIKRELEDGWYQYVNLPMPAVLTIQSGIRKLRYATLMGIKKARSKELKILPASERSAHAATMRLHPPVRAKQSQIFTASAPEAAHELFEKLRFEARVI